MVTTNDIVASASGRVHIGIDGGTNPGSFDIGSISPFGHIFQLSGVFMDPLIGQSGVIRYSKTQDRFEVSVDGGNTFNPIITTVNLQVAYNGGRDVQLAGVKIGPAGALDGAHPILLVEPPGHFSSDTFLTPGPPRITGGVAVSGSTWTPVNINTFSFAKLSSYGLYLQSSGTPTDAPYQAYLRTTPGGANLFLLGKNESDTSISAQSGIGISVQQGNISLSAGEANGAKGQLSLSAFAGSGQLEYRFGPYQAWHWKPSYSSIFHPIPHSGQIRQMILEASAGSTSLDGAYDIGDEIDAHIVSIKTARKATLGPVIKTTVGGLNPSTTIADAAGAVSDVPISFGICVSGYTPIAFDALFDAGTWFDTFPQSRLSENMLYIRGSGLWTDNGGLADISINEMSASMWVGVSGYPNFSNACIRSSIGLDIFGQSLLTIGSNGPFTSNGQSAIFNYVNSCDINSPFIDLLSDALRFRNSSFYPQISGVGSIGHDRNIPTTNPFSSIHFLSGVLHDPQYGASGIFRYNRASPFNSRNIVSGAIEFSINGGQTFDPILNLTQSIDGIITTDISANGNSRFTANTTDNAARFQVPSGMKMVVLACEGRANINGTTQGDYTIGYGLTEFAVNDSGNQTNTPRTLCSSTNPRGLHHAYAEGTPQKPLLTVSGGTPWMLIITNAGSSPGSTGTGTKGIILTYKYIKDISSAIQ